MKRARIPTRDYEAVLRAAWARGWHYHPEQEPRTMPAPNPDPAILGMLAELETVLAEAEELRYRILCAVRNTAQASTQNQPVAALPKPAPAPAPEPKPELDTSALVRSGRGLWAWAKENHHASQLIELGKAAAFPPRMVDWSREQVEEAIEALAILITQPAPTRSTAPTPAHAGPQAEPRPSPHPRGVGPRHAQRRPGRTPGT